MGWYTGTARAPAPKIWQPRPKTVAPTRDRAAAPRTRWRRLRRRRLLTRTGSGPGLLVATVVFVGLALFFVVWAAAFHGFDLHDIGLRLADALRRPR